jgi:uncharacterized damage-inducible protein DinB
MTTETISEKRKVAGSAKNVFKFMTDSGYVTCWLCERAQTAPQPEGYFLFVWNEIRHAYGTFSTLDVENFHLEAQWKDEQAESVWRVWVKELDFTECEVRVEQEGPALFSDYYQAFWYHALNNLVSAFHSGQDLRYSRRGVLGIQTQAVNPAVSVPLGLNPRHALLVSAVLHGLGAHEAGIQVGDIIYQINERPVSYGLPFTFITDNIEEQNEVSVFFYRRGVAMEKKARLLPYPYIETPPNMAALASQCQSNYQQLDKSLQSFLAPLPPNLINTPVEEGAWTVKEHLAHLILRERWLHNWIGGWLQGGFVQTNSDTARPRLAALLAVYDDVQPLQEVLRQTWAETLALVAIIPHPYNERKMLRWWFSCQLNNNYLYSLQQLEQMKSSVAAIKIQQVANKLQMPGYKRPRN